MRQETTALPQGSGRIEPQSSQKLADMARQSRGGDYSIHLSGKGSRSEGWGHKRGRNCLPARLSDFKVPCVSFLLPP